MLSHFKDCILHGNITLLMKPFMDAVSLHDRIAMAGKKILKIASGDVRH